MDSVKYSFLKEYVQSTEHFDYLDNIAKKHRILFIGENKHGVEEFSAEKIKIIDYLAQKHGYKTLVFESGLAECHEISVQKEVKSNEVLIKQLMESWQTNTMLLLFDVLRKNKMNFEGLGTQKDIKGTFYEDCIHKATPKNATFFTQSDTIFKWVHNYFFVKKGNKNTNEWIEQFKTDKAFYKTAEGFKKLYTNELAYLLKVKNQTTELKIIERVIQRKLALALRIIERQKNPVAGLLDKEMLEDLDFIVNELYPSEKIIVWTHNDYMAKVHSANKKSAIWNDKWFKKNQANSYMLSFHFLEGDYSQGQTDLYYRVKKAEYNSLPAILGSLSNRKSYFINLSALPKNKTTQPLFELIEENIHGRGYFPKQIIPNRYDGIFFIRKVSLPNYLTIEEDVKKTKN